MTLVGTGPSVWVKRLDAKRTDLSTTLDSLFCCLPIGFPGGSDGKMSAYNVGDPGSIPGSGRSPDQEKEMATHSSILAWKIPWTEEPGRLQSVGLQRVGHD